MSLVSYKCPLVSFGKKKESGSLKFMYACKIGRELRYLRN